LRDFEYPLWFWKTPDYERRWALHDETIDSFGWKSRSALTVVLRQVFVAVRAASTFGASHFAF
jgi:hypothetical protein